MNSSSDPTTPQQSQGPSGIRIYHSKIMPITQRANALRILETTIRRYQNCELKAAAVVNLVYM